MPFIKPGFRLLDDPRRPGEGCPAGWQVARRIMGNVLEFQSARLQLHGVLLRELGVPDVFAWRVLCLPRERLWDGDLYAAPLVVATRRDGTVYVIDLKRGLTPADVTDDRARRAVLDAAVVQEHLRRRGCPCSSISCWVVFEDGGRIEISAPPELLAQMRQRAQRALRDREIPALSTHELAAQWDSLVESGAHAL